MTSDTLGYHRSAMRPILRLLASFPVACFACALATDIAYTQTANMMWADFSAWLLAAGLGFGVLAAIVGAVYLVVRRGDEAGPFGAVVIGSLIALVVAAFDNLVHSRDAWTSVMPTGLLLSTLLVVVTFATLWLASLRSVHIDPRVRYSGARR